MKYFMALIFTTLVTDSLAQNLNVDYAGVGSTVVTGQTGNVTITIQNDSPVPIDAEIEKSWNLYQPGASGPDVEFTPDFTSTACDWQYFKIFPRPPGSDGVLIRLYITDIPANSTISCTGTYLVNMTAGSHVVGWFLLNGANPPTVDEQLFLIGPLPTNPVPFTNQPVLILMFLLFMLIGRKYLLLLKP